MQAVSDQPDGRLMKDEDEDEDGGALEYQVPCLKKVVFQTWDREAF